MGPTRVARGVRGELRTTCAYKGHASYWSVRTGGQLRENLAWTYREPRADAALVRDLICFFNEQVDIEVDGRQEARVDSHWSGREWWHAVLEFEAQL